MPPLGGIFFRGNHGRKRINTLLDSTGGHMGRTSSYCKQAINYFLVLALIFAPAFSYASTQSLGGWSLGGMVAQGASSVLSASRNILINGKNVAQTATALITPTATQVAKLLGKGVAGVAVSVAVQQLLGAVDWVMDPANNQIVYTQNCEIGGTCPTSKYLYYGQNGGKANTTAPTASQACDLEISYLNKVLPGRGYTKTSFAQNSCNFKTSNGNTGSSTISALNNPNYDASAEKQKKTLPLDVVAQQVISNADSGDTAAQVATTAAAADIVNDAQNDSAKARPIVNQLDANATTKTDESATAQSKPNTATGGSDLSISFPVFCGWAPTICQAAQTVISFPQTLTNWWDKSVNSLSEAYTYAQTQVQTVRDYFNDEPPKNDDTVLDIPEPPLPDINTDLNFGGACPVSRTVPISFAGISTQIEFSFQPLCDIASFIKPVVITISAFSSALIIAGIREND